jgi:hypothetical protein
MHACRSTSRRALNHGPKCWSETIGQVHERALTVDAIVRDEVFGGVLESDATDARRHRSTGCDRALARLQEIAGGFPFVRPRALFEAPAVPVVPDPPYAAAFAYVTHFGFSFLR